MNEMLEAEHACLRSTEPAWPLLSSFTRVSMSLNSQCPYEQIMLLHIKVYTRSDVCLS